MKSTPVTLLALAASVLLLSGCFGGGGDDDAPMAPTPDPLAEVPSSASQSSSGFMAYLRLLADNRSDTREPVTLGGFSPPAPDDTEPEPVL